MADYKNSLETIYSVVHDARAFEGSKPRFKNVVEMDSFLRTKGFHLTDNQPFGPNEPDARQLIYQGPNNVIIKVKTRGYVQGRRMGRAFMSVEATDGKGTKWENTLFKVDSNGKIIAKNLINADELAHLPDGSWGVRRGSTGKVEPIVKFEVIQGGQSPPFNKDQWADRGHLDFAEDFEPGGAAILKPGGVRINPAEIQVRAVGKFVGFTIAAAGVMILLAWLRAKMEQESIQQQIKDLEPQINAEVQKKRLHVLNLLEVGKKAWANVTISIMTIASREAEPGGPPLVITTWPAVSLKWVGISDRDIEIQGAPKREFQITQTVTTVECTFSVEVGL
jgi:hypothetical protein